MITTYDLQLTSPQTALQNGQLVSRIFTDVSGRSFRLTFFVSIIDGEVKGKLVSAQEMGQGEVDPVGDPAGSAMSYEQSAYIFCLPFVCPKIIPHTSYFTSPALLVSPYLSLEFLFTSQPTRAPSKK